MKAVVVYKSKSGFVRNYAEWISEALSADIFDASEVTVDRLAAYDTIVYGGGLYVSGINGVKIITKNLDKLKGKKLVVFASGASPFREEDMKNVIKSNFTEEQLKLIRFFYMRGGFNYDRLTPVDKVLMLLKKWLMRGKKKQTADERGMLTAYDKPLDFTKRENISELVAYVNGQ